MQPKTDSNQQSSGIYTPAICMGDAIRKARRNVGLTQKDVAASIGITDKAVSKWERGLSVPDVSCLSKLAVLLDMDIELLVASAAPEERAQWCGLLVLPLRENGIRPWTLIHDKPAICYLLSYFLLSGIRDITIIQGDNSDYIYKLFGDGSILGINLKIISESDFRFNRKSVSNRSSVKKVFSIFDYLLFDGVDLTRLLERAMAHCSNLASIAYPLLPYGQNCIAHGRQTDQEVARKSHRALMMERYAYTSLPIIFCSRDIVESAVSEIDDAASFSKALLSLIESKDIDVVLADRGYLSVLITNKNHLASASEYVELHQRLSGMKLRCVEEIAWRRGFIDDKGLVAAGRKISGHELSDYIEALLGKSKPTVG